MEKISESLKSCYKFFKINFIRMKNLIYLPKPDVLITWPSGCDYPLCRFQPQTFRGYFDQVIISTYDHGTPDFRAFLKTAMKKTAFVDLGHDNVHWRERCVLAGLEKSEIGRAHV
jgi:hypothetical protein